MAALSTTKSLTISGIFDRLALLASRKNSMEQLKTTSFASVVKRKSFDLLIPLGNVLIFPFLFGLLGSAGLLSIMQKSLHALCCCHTGRWGGTLWTWLRWGRWVWAICWCLSSKLSSVVGRCGDQVGRIRLIPASRVPRADFLDHCLDPFPGPESWMESVWKWGGGGYTLSVRSSFSCFEILRWPWHCSLRWGTVHVYNLKIPWEPTAM